jgi:hypothetical protein
MMYLGCIKKNSNSGLLTKVSFLESMFWTTQRHEFLNDLLGTGKKPYYRESI